MSKKKSKTAKQSAARAAGRHSAAFVKKLGIVPSKCFDKKSQRSDAIVAVDLRTSKPRTSQPNIRSAAVRIHGKGPPGHPSLVRSAAGTHSSRPRPRPREGGDEQSEFGRQLRSLNERSGVEDGKRRTQRTREFAPVPESFSSVPTPAEMLDSTTQQIQALDGLGEHDSRQHERISEEAATGLMVSSAYWSSLSPVEKASSESNPWAALEDDTEDEGDAEFEGASTLRRRKVSQKSQHFQFQPATFFTQDRTSNMNIHFCQGGYDDPDL
jgi:hypothetical protein